MKNLLKRKWFLNVSGSVWCLFLIPSIFGAGHKEHPYRNSEIDVPISLAVGAQRTPEFSVDWSWYDIMVQVEEPLPFLQMQCMMGVTTSPLDSKKCRGGDPLLRGDWTVWDGNHLVDKGAIPNRCSCKFEDKYMYKFLGGFSGEAGKKYVVEVRFTKDGTPLNAANPHLIVIQHKLN
jgi:hypothetical protein